MKKILTLVILLIFCSCVSVTAIPIGNKTYPPHTRNVMIYENEEDVEREFEKIAMITAKTSDGEVVNDNMLISKMRTKAQSLGADALIFKATTTSSWTEYGINETMRVTAIKFIE